MRPVELAAEAGLAFPFVGTELGRKAGKDLHGGEGQGQRESPRRDIGLEDVVRGVDVGRTTLLKQFRKEAGFTIRNYLLRLRLMEACRFLTYTDTAISRLAMGLCSSSQSYFTNVFRKAMGLTPDEYGMAFRKRWTFPPRRRRAFPRKDFSRRTLLSRERAFPKSPSAFNDWKEDPPL